MRAGDRVTYIDGGGVEVAATVVAVVGSGPSWHKVLDLAVGSLTLLGVPHEKDAAPNAGRWRLGEPVTRKRRRNPVSR